LDGWVICYHVWWVAENWAGIEREEMPGWIALVMVMVASFFIQTDNEEERRK
jgi:hypothetical protein